MNTKDLKVGDFAVNVSDELEIVTIGKKYPMLAVGDSFFAIIDDTCEILQLAFGDWGWSFEPNPFLRNNQSVIVEVATKVLVTFEKTEIEHGEEYLIKTIELADMPDLRKEVEYQVRNLANQALDVINVKWEK